MAAPVLAGRSVLITGGGTGIGASTALALADAGARLVITGRRREPLEVVAEAVRAQGGECRVVPGDVGDYRQVEAAVEATCAAYGGLDALVANAALVDHRPVAESDPAEWDALIRTNVLGVLYSARAAIPRMLSAGHGDIVIVSSISGRGATSGSPPT